MPDTKSMPGWAKRLFRFPHAPIARSSGEDSGVWIAEGANTTATISEQFRANAGEYHTRYAASDHFEHLFRQALEHSGVKVAVRPLILDLGSGSGANSVAPCLRIFPGARIIATDLSGELLAMLADALPALQAKDQVVCTVMDAMKPTVWPASVDVVTGSAILHHLTEPTVALEAAAIALKRGGVAIFMEPFDGYGLMRLAYQRILAEAALRGESLPPSVVLALDGLREDIAARTSPDKTTAAFAALDDKWLFSQERFTKMAEATGFSRAQFVPHNDHPSLYRDVAITQLRLASGIETLELPAWALDVLDEFDAALPLVVKRRMMLEGSIVLTRGRDPFKWRRVWRRMTRALRRS